MNRTAFIVLGIGIGLAAPTVSSAQTAFTTKEVNMRAGPSRDYPLVMQIPEGAGVDINGCVDDLTWCDVSLGPDRGWVYAGNLVSPYQDRRVVILNNGPYFQFPIVTFSVGPYWDTYYRGRPWYSRRSYWSNRPPPPHSIRPPVSRPPSVRPPSSRPPRPEVVRPPVSRPRSQPAPVAPRPQGRPETVRPQSQPARPAPAKPPDRSQKQPPRRDDHKPGGN